MTLAGLPGPVARNPRMLRRGSHRLNLILRRRRRRLHLHIDRRRRLIHRLRGRLIHRLRRRNYHRRWRLIHRLRRRLIHRLRRCHHHWRGAVLPVSVIKDPLAAFVYPARLHPGVTRTRSHPVVPVDPDVAIAAPHPVTRHPDVTWRRRYRSNLYAHRRRCHANPIHRSRRKDRLRHGQPRQQRAANHYSPKQDGAEKRRCLHSPKL